MDHLFALNDEIGNSVVLSAEQEHVLELVKSGQSVFFTGPAGNSVCLFQCRRRPQPLFYRYWEKCVAAGNNQATSCKCLHLQHYCGDSINRHCWLKYWGFYCAFICRNRFGQGTC
ncbi:hypothetical protein GALMADRAFT_347356 [Galerina marginata CBS 339.88]|uniref:Uncharacterized protein n=1 Tax=Galerina marginata (strain CBS 339.88) TaxID=685588 RepID=A0A067TPZ5_GALM3|nr:hypothetical protein GALMADRAFT_347356 [Galerina marginata CBS 339.88]